MAILAVMSFGAQASSIVGGGGATTGAVNRKLWEGGTTTLTTGLHPDGRSQHYGAHYSANAPSKWVAIAAAAQAKLRISGRVWLVAGNAPTTTALLFAVTCAGNGASYGVQQSAAAGHDLQVVANGVTMTLKASPSTGVAYWIDLLLDFSATTHTVDAWLDGVYIGQAQKTAQTISNATLVTLGSGSNVTSLDAWVSDVIAYDSTDGPIGKHTVYTCLPNASGTHATGGAGNFTDDAAANVVDGETTSYTKVADTPADLTSYVRQAVNDAARSRYLEYNLQSIPVTGHVVKAVRLVGGSFPQASALANEAAMRLYDAQGATATSEAVWDNSLTQDTLEYHCHFYAARPAALGAWTEAAANDIRARVGYSNDVSPLTAWTQLLAEILVEDVVRGTASGTSATSASATGSATHHQYAGTAAATSATSATATGTATHHAYSGTAAATSATSASATGSATHHLTLATAEGTSPTSATAAGSGTHHDYEGTATATSSTPAAAVGTATNHQYAGTGSGTSATSATAIGVAIQTSGRAGGEPFKRRVYQEVRYPRFGEAVGTSRTSGHAIGTARRGRRDLEDENALLLLELGFVG